MHDWAEWSGQEKCTEPCERIQSVLVLTEPCGSSQVGRAKGAEECTEPTGPSKVDPKETVESEGPNWMDPCPVAGGRILKELAEWAK